ncbi:MAG: hypothetical protein EBV23_12340, partial [Flavobacteriia bacterium]|nr:hypothetical protein [Flavobacteriia bacterium]
PGTSYALLVNNFSASTGFTLTFNNNNPNGGTFQGPAPQITSSALNICQGDSVVFDATASQFCNSYTWNFTPNALPSNASGIGPHTISYPNLGNFVAILNGIDNTGCQTVDVVNVQVNPPIQINLPPYDTICSGTNFFATITSNPSVASFNYVPSNNPNITGSAQGSGGSINQILTNTSNTVQNITYYVSTAVNGCGGNDSITVSLSPLTEPQFSPIGPLCLGLIPAPLLPQQSNNLILGNWTPSIINTQQLGVFNSIFTPNPGQCADTSSMAILISDNPGVSFVADTLLGCSPLQGTLSTANLPGATYNWLANGQQIGTNPSIDYSFSNPGCYDIELQVDISGCSASSVVSDYICVEADPVASFSFSPGEFTSPSEIVHFNNGTQGGSQYFWNYGDGTNSTMMEGSHTYNNTSGGYFVTLIASSPSGCTDSITQFIGYQEPLIYYIPNTFTPDQDQFNPTWKPIFTSGFEPYDYHALIYNRWGELIWESYNPFMGWDGTYGMQLHAQPGTYTWEIVFGTKVSDEKIQLTGTLNLLR